MIDWLEWVQKSAVGLTLSLLLALSTLPIFAKVVVWLVQTCPKRRRGDRFLKLICRFLHVPIGRLGPGDFWSVASEWVVIFAIVNAGIFAGSLYELAKLTEKSFWDVLNSELLSAQIGMLLLTASLMMEDAPKEIHIARTPNDGNRRPLTFALIAGCWSNLLALGHSALAFLKPEDQRAELGSIHFGIWLAQNLSCVLFFTLLLFLIRKRAYTYLMSRRFRWIWLFPILALVASALDFLLAINK